MSAPNPARRSHLLHLWCSGLTLREIADQYGGTAKGVRSTIRKMRERGEAPDRIRIGKHKWIVA